MEKYKHFHNPYPNNISDGNGGGINILDLMMERHYPKLKPTDYLIQKIDNQDTTDEYYFRIECLREYLVTTFQTIQEDWDSETEIPNDDGEVQFAKGFYHLLALYDVMNREELRRKEKESA